MSRRYQAWGGHWLPGCRTRQEEKELRAAYLVRDGFRCGYCGVDLRKAGPKEVTLDHLRVQRNRTAEPENLIVACRSCNSSKGRRSWRQFAAPRPAVRILEVVQRPVDRSAGAAYLSGELVTDELVDPIETWVRRPGERVRHYHRKAHLSPPTPGSAIVCEPVRESVIIEVSERKGEEVSTTTRTDAIRQALEFGQKIDFWVEQWKSRQVKRLDGWCQGLWFPMIDEIPVTDEDDLQVDYSPIEEAIQEYREAYATDWSQLEDTWDAVRHSIREVIAQAEDALEQEMSKVQNQEIDWDAVDATVNAQLENADDDEEDEDEDEE